MKSEEHKSLYFKKAGEEATEMLFKFVKDCAKKRGIKDLVVASTTGATGAKASKIFRGLNLVVVTHHSGFAKPSGTELTEKNRKRILANGAKIVTGTHALSGVERAIRRKFNTLEPMELVASTYRTFGQGTKVCVEIALMAADAGLVPVDRDIISMAGTGKGADTALLLRPANSSSFFDLKIREVIAKPSDF
jgi:hypothetical protein